MKEWLKRRGIWWLVAFATIVLLLGNKHFQRMIFYRKTRKQLQKEIEILKEKNFQIEKEIEELKTNPDKALRRYAREKLGMIENGEKKVIFIEE